MQEERDNEATTWTVKEVLENVPRLGIPHFQRGLVWGDDSTAALLESLFYDTPCGSFVLWQPADCQRLGVPMLPSENGSIDYLIVDGQQRTHSIYDVFRGNTQDSALAGSPSDQDEDDSPNRVWCINLSRLPHYKKQLTPLGRDFPLFVRIADPAASIGNDRRAPLKRHALPLDRVRTIDSWLDPELAPYRTLLGLDQELGTTLYAELHESVSAMERRQFFISIQKSDDLNEMVNLYNRINAGGKRVDVEERVFARLVGLQSTTYPELANLFEQVHGKDCCNREDKNNDAQLERNDLLQRQRERAFGFKLFIRVFLQVCQHHLGLQQNKGDYSFDIAGKAAFLERFANLTDDQTRRLWLETAGVLVHVRDVLSKELACDDLRTLPDIFSLTPLFQLLINYPGLRGDRYRLLLADVALRLMLAELNSPLIRRLVLEAGDPSEVAVSAVSRMRKTLNARLSYSQLVSRLAQANSIQNRYVLLLYWLQRRRTARDFLYTQVRGGSSLMPPERLLERIAVPEKQHLLPFKKAQAVYPGEPRRGGSHAVNSVGNLTYISQELNGFDKGLGDEFANLVAEPLENQRAHLLRDEIAGDRVLREYEKLRTSLCQETVVASKATLQRWFQEMTRRRREIMGRAWSQWLEELGREAAKALGAESLESLETLSVDSEGRLEPAAPMFAPLKDQNVAHVIRRLGLEHQAKHRVIELARWAARVRVRDYELPKVDFWLTKKKKLIWIKTSPGLVAVRFRADVAMDRRREVLRSLGLVAPTDAIGESYPLNTVPDFEDLCALMSRLGPIVENDVDIA